MDKAVFFVSGCLQYIIDSSVVHLRITLLYPFMANNNRGQLFVFILIVSGIFVSVFIQYRLKEKFSLNQDQQYIRIKQYEKALYLGKENN